MGYECYNSKCPCCGKAAVWSKVEPNSIGCFQFDACISCGFIEFETPDIRGYDETTRQSRIDTWNMLIEHYEQCGTSFKSFKEIREHISSSYDPDAHLVFDYSKFSKSELENMCIKESEITWGK